MIIKRLFEGSSETEQPYVKFEHITKFALDFRGKSTILKSIHNVNIKLDLKPA